MALPDGWSSQDIGTPSIAGSADYAGGVYTLTGSGSDIESYSDNFHFAYKSLNGDGTIVARVTGLTNTHAWAKAGVMIRESLNDNSRHAALLLTPDNVILFQRRTATDGTTDISLNYSGNTWYKVVRSSSTFSAFRSSDGNTWTQIETDITISMGTNVYIGLAVCSHNNAELATATYDNLSITTTGATALPRRALDGPFYGSLRGSVR